MLGSLGAGNILLAAAAYDSDALRQTLAERGAWANVKPMPRRRHVLAFSSFLYRYRNLVERFFNKLKHFRAVATRHDKNPENYLAAVKLASARIWMRANESMTQSMLLQEMIRAARRLKPCSIASRMDEIEEQVELWRSPRRASDRLPRT